MVGHDVYDRKDEIYCEFNSLY